MKEQTIRFKDAGIFYTIYPNEKKPTLVLLHPYGSSSTLFEGIIPNLKKIVQILIIDLPSHGKSEHSKHVNFSDMPEIIQSILSKENIRNAHFVGISEGSLIAQAFAQLYPNKLQSLISMSSYSIFHDSFKVVKADGFFHRIKLFFLWVFMFKRYKKSYIERSAISSEGKKLFEKSMKSLRRSSAFSKKGIKRFYNLGKQNYSYPTYVVCGNDDLGVIKDASLQYEQIVPKTILEGISNAKQVVFLDNPRLFVDRVRSFIQSVETN